MGSHRDKTGKCMRACVRACARACVRSCVHTCKLARLGLQRLFSCAAQTNQSVRLIQMTPQRMRRRGGEGFGPSPSSTSPSSSSTSPSSSSSTSTSPSSSSSSTSPSSSKANGSSSRSSSRAAQQETRCATLDLLLIWDQAGCSAAPACSQ